MDIPWDNIQLSILTTWIYHREGCEAITLLDRRCTCGLLDQLVKTEYPGANGFWVDFNSHGHAPRPVQRETRVRVRLVDGTEFTQQAVNVYWAIDLPSPVAVVAYKIVA